VDVNCSEKDFVSLRENTGVSFFWGVFKDMETVCKGFKAAGVAAKIKKDDEKKKDLGLIFSEKPATVAAVFTRNKVQAAPVLLDKERIRSGMAQAVIANSGNANCCTGEQGMRDAVAMSDYVSSGLKLSQDSVLVASTGVIGKPLPIGKIESAMPKLIAALRSNGFSDFAEAVMTTDTFPKMISEQGKVAGKSFSMIGIAKGSGMIRPDMATMLCFVCTDADVSPKFLQESLSSATDRSFNRITVDGDTSTNDMILVMANGMSEAEIRTPERRALFQDVLDEILTGLARMVAKDGEGATKLVEISVKGAVSDKDARVIADTIAHSNLVKTALFGEDANWGRILAAAGRAGVPLDPDKIAVFFNDVQMVKAGMGCGSAAEAEATKVLKTPEFIISVDLNMGKGNASVLTCDFSLDYVRINADYRTCCLSVKKYSGEHRRSAEMKF